MNKKPLQARIREYSLGFSTRIIRDEDFKACFRHAVARVQQLMVQRLCGRSSPLSEDDQKLLDGEIEFLVPSGHTINITDQPQVSFKPEKLVLDDEAADWYDVVDIKIGKNSQLISATRLPGTGFKAGVSSFMSMDTAQISMYVTLSLINVSDKPRRLPRAMMTGKGID